MTIKKYDYMSPETEILSLEAKRIIMESVPLGSEGDDVVIISGSSDGAPWRY